MTLIRPEGEADACPRCGLFHDPADHGLGHQHDFPLETITTCRSVVSIRGKCECGEPAPHLRYRLGGHLRDPLVLIGRAIGFLGKGETYADS